MENREQGGVRSLSTTQVWHTVNALLGHGELLAHPSLKPVLSALKEPRPGTQSWTCLLYTSAHRSGGQTGENDRHRTDAGWSSHRWPTPGPERRGRGGRR